MIKNIRFKGEFLNILKLAWPVMIGMILQSLLGTVDLKFITMIGNGQNAVEPAAASLGNSAAGVIFVISTLISTGAVALISRRYGEGNKEAVKKIAGEAFLLSIIFGVIIGCICYFNTTKILKIMYAPDNDVLILCSQYLKIIFLGTFLVFLNFTIRTILQSIGDTKTPLYVFGFSNIVNMILDYIMIFVFNMGIKGAALATVTSNLVSFLIITYLLIKKVYDLSITDFLINIKLRFKNCFMILKIGSWACIQQATRPITGMLMFRIVNKVGEKEAVAAFGVGGQLFNYTYIFLSGLIVAISVMVGQNLGKKDIKKAEAVIADGLKLAIINMIIFLVPYMILPDLIMRIFTINIEIINIGVHYLRIVYTGLFFVVFSTVYGGAFQGSGDTFPPMISSIIANVFVKLPLAYILAVSLNFGTNGVWMAISVSIIVESIIIIMFFRKGTWKRKEI